MLNSPKRVFVIGVEGAMGRAVKLAKTPTIDAVIENGVFTYQAQAVLPSASFQNWGALLHGVEATVHQISDSNPIQEDTPFPSFLKVLQQSDPTLSCAAFSCWNPINQYIIEQSIDCHRVSKPDSELVHTAAQYIRQSPPDLFFMQLDDVDAAGHREGYGSEKYLQQIEKTDSEIGVVVQAIHDANIYSESLILIISDHGGFGTGHGGDAPECLENFRSIRGPGVTQGIELDQPLSIKDTASVILHAFNVPIPHGYEGNVRFIIFEN